MKNLPNILSIVRITIVPIFLVFVLTSFCSFNLYLAFVLFTIGAITDFLDGYIARKYNLVTTIGKFLDPIADKILFLSGLIAMVYIQFTTSVLPNGLVYVTIISFFIILARDYVVDAIRQISSSQGRIIPADKYGKLKTIVQDIALPLMLLYFALVINSGLEIVGFIYFFGIFAYSLFIIGVLLTILSGANYLVKNRDIFGDKK